MGERLRRELPWAPRDDEFLAMEIFEGVRNARDVTASWRDEYHTLRPDSWLRYQTPAGFAAVCGDARCS